MKVTDIISIENNESANFTIIWFAVDRYPEDVFVLKTFPNMKKNKLKSEYICQKASIQNVKKISDIEKNLPKIKDLIKDSDKYKLKTLLDKSGYPFE